MESVAWRDGRPVGARRTRARRQLLPSPRAILFGILAAITLLALYLGLITLAQGWSHATAQLSLDRWYVATIALGFGTQVGLFSWLRTLHTSAMAAGGVAASTGTSTMAMLACCAHHVADVLPVLGLSGAAIFLNDYKTELLWLGITMNAAGVIYMLARIRNVLAQFGESSHVPAI
jgi:hypothetical protein